SGSDAPGSSSAHDSGLCSRGRRTGRRRRCYDCCLRTLQQGLAMKRLDWVLACIVLVAGGAHAADEPMLSGIDLQYFDDSVRAQDDFYRHVNGKCLDSVE